MMLRTIGAAMAVMMAACATSEQSAPPTATLPTGGDPIEASLMNNEGAEIGKVQLTPGPTGVLLRVLARAGALAPGWHGAHLHMVGDCSDPAKFERAGGHIEKNNTNHGLLYVHGPETGDLPNLSVASDGSASAELFTNLTNLSELQDSDGSAFMIHADPDDHTSQPTGNSGDRVACAVIRE